MESWNFIVVDIQAVKALLCFVLVPFFIIIFSPQLDEGNKTFEDDTSVVTQALRFLHSFPLNEGSSLKLSYKLVVGHGGDIDRERCTMIGPEITVTRCSKGLSIHIWGKWENRSLNEWVTAWKQGRGCRFYSPKYLLHFTRQCPRQPWDPYITLKLTLVWIANWIAWHAQ